MEEDILQVVKYCTDLIEDKDLEKLDLIIKYMKRYWTVKPPPIFCVPPRLLLWLLMLSSLCRLMQKAVESVWSMAFDFILDNVQVVVQQAYGSTLKVAWGRTEYCLRWVIPSHHHPCFATFTRSPAVQSMTSKWWFSSWEWDAHWRPHEQYEKVLNDPRQYLNLYSLLALVKGQVKKKGIKCTWNRLTKTRDNRSFSQNHNCNSFQNKCEILYKIFTGSAELLRQDIPFTRFQIPVLMGVFPLL